MSISNLSQHTVSQPLTSQNSVNSPIDPRIIKLIKIYEEKHNVFESLGICRKENYEFKIFYEIQDTLLLGLNINFETIFDKDYESFAMMLAAFYGQRIAIVDENHHKNPREPVNYVNKDVLNKCKHPLHTIMVMCYIAYTMQKKLEAKDSGHDEGEVYQKLKDELEDLACQIVNHLNSNGAAGSTRVSEALQADYKTGFTSNSSTKIRPYHDYLNRKFDQSREIMAIAYKAKAMKFLSQRPCLHLMETRNKTRKTNKHMINGTFRAAYILMFAYMLCRYPFYSSYDSTSSLSFFEMLPFLFVPAVLIAQVSMTIIKTIDHLIFDHFHLKTGSNPFAGYISTVRRYVHTKKLAFWRVCLVVPLQSLEAIRFVVFAGLPSKPRNFWSGGWVILPILLELLYCSLFAIATISSLRFFHSIQSIGFFVHIFKKMMKTVGMFILIFSTFWFVLAVTHVSLSRALLVHNTTFIYTLSIPGKFEIFGEVQDEDRIGILSNCSHFSKTFWDFFEMDYAEASCLFRSTIMPFLVFTYIFVSGILLINLLTAQLTKEYEKQLENSRYYKGYLKYELVTKIESKLYLPPPLSLFYILIRLITCIVLLIIWAIHKCIQKCCKKPPAQYGVVTIRPSNFSMYTWETVIEKMEGHPWGVVHNCTDLEDVEKKISDFLSKNSSRTVFDELKDITDSFEKDGHDVYTLMRLRDGYNSFLERKIQEENARNQAAISGI